MCSIREQQTIMTLVNLAFLITTGEDPTYSLVPRGDSAYSKTTSRPSITQPHSHMYHSSAVNNDNYVLIWLLLLCSQVKEQTQFRLHLLRCVLQVLVRILGEIDSSVSGDDKMTGHMTYKEKTFKSHMTSKVQSMVSYLPVCSVCLYMYKYVCFPVYLFAFNVYFYMLFMFIFHIKSFLCLTVCFYVY